MRHLVLIATLVAVPASAGVHTGRDAPQLFHALIGGVQHLCTSDEEANIRCITQEEMDDLPQVPFISLPNTLRPFHYDFDREIEDAEEIPGLSI